VRNLIYGYMTLPGIQNQDAKAWLGFAATCHQAKQEAEEEGVRQQWQFVQDLQMSARVIGHELRLPRNITTASDFIGLEELTLITDASLDEDWPYWSYLEGLRCIAVENLRIHFTSPELPDHPKGLVHDALTAVEGLVRSSYSDHNFGFAATNVAISFDYRNCTLEDHYEAKKNNELKKELRHRGVKGKQVPKRKHLIIDALLLHDRNNPTPPSMAQQKLLSHTLYGHRLHLDQSGNETKPPRLSSATNQRDSV
jgi:hypothetical protein